ncbi:S-adenosylmethionine:tRNA ribosyltransferase-isomerase [Hymenobacter cellulosilyticus]|uniref:S-adenosylmethionine:tRNA ribosyltransferase-isomerase n=1 Tax=Hymenobacter cellulosilyticus TaxID=2932248 RepID=UPI002880AB77|nr:S-adenosylmethionine:tRNA ribosyltransferase-isomerase [Hymenobacter cellulosilyticus]
MSATPDPRLLSIFDYTYELPAARIAPEPLPNRDQSQLLVYRQGSLQDRRFTDLPTELPADALLVFNNTKVVRARLFCHKPTGASWSCFAWSR